MSEMLNIDITGSIQPSFGGWTCTSIGIGSTCSSSSGVGNIGNKMIVVAAGGSVTYSYTSTALPVRVSWSANSKSSITMTARLTANVSGYTDTNNADNTSTIVSKVK
jgi:hypothetical protein